MEKPKEEESEHQWPAVEDHLYGPAMGDFYLPDADSPVITDDEWTAATAAHAAERAEEPQSDLPEPALAAIAEAERLGFVVSSVERGPVKAVVALPEGELETTLERVTVVRTDQEDVPATWVLLDDGWVHASGIELP